jgi:hypothetical protein
MDSNTYKYHPIHIVMHKVWRSKVRYGVVARGKVWIPIIPFIKNPSFPSSSGNRDDTSKDWFGPVLVLWDAV